MAKATKLEEIYGVTEPKPLDDHNWDQYVNVDDARGSFISEKVVEQLRAARQMPGPLHVLFAGHTGCGKSTELERIKRELKGEYEVQVCRVDDRYSLPGLDYRQLLFLCAQLLIDAAKDANAPLTNDDKAAIEEWFETKTVEDVRKRGWDVRAEGGAEVKFLAALFAKFSGAFFSGGETKATAVRYVEDRLDALRLNMVTLVRAVEAAIKPKKLLLVLEGLDKIEAMEKARSLFIDSRPQLMSIPCSVIYTCPIRLWYDADGLQTYPARCLLPMISVREPPGRTEDEQKAVAERGHKCLSEIIDRRIDAASDVLAADARTFLIQQSGGVLRDLMYMLREAALEAKVAGKQRIEREHAQRAANLLQNDYVKRLSPPITGNKDVTLEDIDAVLGKASDWPRQDAPQNAAFRQLLQSLCILEYNGKGWHDLHPLVRDHLEMREREAARRKISSQPT